MNDVTSDGLQLTATDMWHPVASESELAYYHVFQGQLLGQELAIWRADDDYVNVWENRCLHRGVRLSIAQNDGRELKCQYHGWRYANRTAACTYIPAHPADAPPRTITNRTYPVRVSSGLVWTTMGQPKEEPHTAGQGLVLRPVPVRARPEDAVRVLLDEPPAPPGADPSIARVLGDLSVEVPGTAVFFVQPADADRAIIRGVLNQLLAPNSPRERLALLRHFDRLLARLRNAAAEVSARGPMPDTLAPVYEPVPAALASMPDNREHRELPTRVRVAQAWESGAGVRALRLEAIGDGVLPSGQPGSHLDVALPNGLVRQYSLVNAPGETGCYVIGVKRTLDSEGGSIAVHETLSEGDVLAVSLPRNNFPLRRDREHTVLVAGGIGITPLLAMAQALRHHRLSYELHYFVAADTDAAFADRLDTLNDVRIVAGLTPEETGVELGRLLSTTQGDENQLYVCGPPPMLDRTRQVASNTGWANHAIHYEYFRNNQDIDDNSRFEVVLARSVMNLTVEPGRTILETLREAGVSVASSCEQGACGTCRVSVIDGVPDHQDVYLDEEEKAAGDSIMTCISRSLTPQLTLDL